MQLRFSGPRLQLEYYSLRLDEESQQLTPLQPTLLMRETFLAARSSAGQTPQSGSVGSNLTYLGADFVHPELTRIVPDAPDFSAALMHTGRHALAVVAVGWAAQYWLQSGI